MGICDQAIGSNTHVLSSNIEKWFGIEPYPYPNSAFLIIPSHPKVLSHKWLKTSYTKSTLVLQVYTWMYMYT